jgi:NEDD4-binding protein 2
MIVISASPKVMVIMRGVSGSGKSTRARELGRGGAVLSSDDFFGPNYDFDQDRVPEAHAWNQQRVTEAMQAGISPIVVDNTNTQAWEMKPYAELAQGFGYQVRIEEPTSDWWKKFRPSMSEAEKDALARELASKNKHGVDEKRARAMLDRWEHGVGIKEIMESRSPFDEA